MINKENLVSLNFLMKENFTGSMQGMRYQFSRIGEKPNFKLEVTIWPEPFSYKATPDNQKQKAEFVFSNDGKDQAVDWLNEQYELQNELWNKVNPYK